MDILFIVGFWDLHLLLIWESSFEVLIVILILKSHHRKAWCDWFILGIRKWKGNFHLRRVLNKLGMRWWLCWLYLHPCRIVWSRHVIIWRNWVWALRSHHSFKILTHKGRWIHRMPWKTILLNGFIIFPWSRLLILFVLYFSLCNIDLWIFINWFVGCLWLLLPYTLLKL